MGPLVPRGHGHRDDVDRTRHVSQDLVVRGDDLLKLLLLGLVVAAAALSVWGALDRRSRAAALIRQRFSGWPGRLLVILVALAVLVVVAEDVLQREQDELVLRLDRLARQTARQVRALPAVRATATAVSRLTGEGLVVLVLVAGTGLVIARRRVDAAIVVGGTLGAWLLATALKMFFAVPRPGRPRTFYAITGYGFPSAHALVTLVACGLVAWALARHATRGARVALYAAAALVAALSGTARVLLAVHWASDVIAGLAVGLVWLNLVILMASRRAGAGPANEGGRAP